MRLVFGGTVEISTVYTNELRAGEQLISDVFLIMRPGTMQELQHHISDPKKVVLVTRTVSEDAIYRLYDIPKGNRVLVVNDSPETTSETVSMLYQLGVTHLNLLPYLQKTDNWQTSVLPSPRANGTVFRNPFPISSTRKPAP